MGRWSWTIMGSDSALDAESEIFDICEANQFPEDNEIPYDQSTLMTKEKLESKSEEIIKEIEDNLVICTVFMQYGAKIPRSLKKNALHYAKHLKREWPETSNLEEFIVALKNYDNKTPTEIEQVGLFQTIIESFNKGEKGLINK